MLTSKKYAHLPIVHSVTPPFKAQSSCQLKTIPAIRYNWGKQSCMVACWEKEMVCPRVPCENFTYHFTYASTISHAKVFQPVYQMKISYVKLIFKCESSISYVKYASQIPTFHMYDFEPIYFTYYLVSYMLKRSDFTSEMKFSHVKMFQFHMFFTCENTREIFVWGEKKFR